METFSLGVAIAALGMEGILLLRAAVGRFLSKFPLFFSYLGYVFAGSLLTLFIYWRWPQNYATDYWFFYLIMLLAEFAVLTEVSDRVFSPYPAIRRLGRLVTVWLAIALASVYILPSLLESKPEAVALLDFAKRATLVKMFMILILLVLSNHYRLPLGRNVSGMMLGFSLYLSVCFANFAVADIFGKALYAPVIKVLFPISYNISLLVWTAALWQYEPARPRVSWRQSSGEKSLESFNSALARLFRR